MSEQVETGQTEAAQQQGVPVSDTGVQESQEMGADVSGLAQEQEMAELKPLGSDTSAQSQAKLGSSGLNLNMDSLLDVPVTLSVEIGRKRMPINQLVNLTPGAIVDLNRDLDAPLDLLVNGTLIARGEVVVMGKKFGLRLVDICSPNERLSGLSQ